MELVESLEEESLLLVVHEGETLDGLGGGLGSSLDSLRRGVESGGSVGALGHSGGLVVLLMVDLQDVFSSNILLSSNLLSGEADGVISGVSLRGSVVESGQVEGVLGEGLVS